MQLKALSNRPTRSEPAGRGSGGEGKGKKDQEKLGYGNMSNANLGCPHCTKQGPVRRLSEAQTRQRVGRETRQVTYQPRERVAKCSFCPRTKRRNSQRSCSVCGQTTCSHSRARALVRSSLMVDFGASLNASPREHAERVPTRASSNVNSECASGEHVAHRGPRTLINNLSSGCTAQVEYEVADVKNPLLSVSSMVGATVTFSPHGCQIPLE